MAFLGPVRPFGVSDVACCPNSQPLYAAWMARLLCAGRDVAPLELALTARTRARGLLGRSEFGGAMLISPARSVHTLGMRFPIDVAHLDANYEVLAVTRMPPNRLGRIVRGARHVLEASAGSMSKWGIERGAKLSVTDEQPGHSAGEAA